MTDERTLQDQDRELTALIEELKQAAWQGDSAAGRVRNAEDRLHQFIAELRTAPAAVTLGVGEGSGQLFVHGSYEAIKRVQDMLSTARGETAAATEAQRRYSAPVAEPPARQPPDAAWLFEFERRKLALTETVLSVNGVGEPPYAMSDDYEAAEAALDAHVLGTPAAQPDEPLWPETIDLTEMVRRGAAVASYRAAYYQRAARRTAVLVWPSTCFSARHRGAAR